MAGFEPDFGRLDTGPPGERTPEGGAPPRFRVPDPGRGRRFLLRLAATFEREIDQGRGFLWLAVAYAAGILIYFALPSEPWAPALVTLTALLAIGAVRQAFRRVGLFRLLLVAAMLAAGVTTIKLRTDRAAAPRLDRQLTGTLSGFVEAREARRGGFRLTIRVVSFEARGLKQLTERVTVTVRGAAPEVGEGATMLARLRPPSGPAMPGGYDFGLPAYYDGIGATGFAYGRASPADLGPAPLSIRLKVPLERVREGIRARIAASLSGDTARIATALTIGDPGGISEAGEEALRSSGLAHVLSVSGLHMVLVAGVVFWSVRALLALFPALVLRRPIKKWAAIAALLVTGFYLLISGLDVAAQRSFVMTGIVFLAVLVDRRAISMRNVALAALIVLAIRPESLLAAGFQMSFAATIALVAGFEALARRRPRGLRGSNRSVAGSVLRWLVLLVGGLVVTSLLGGLGTTPFALYHFQRMAPLSILANVAAMPIVDFLVMPAALFAVLAMPFGLDGPVLAAMGVGIDAMMAVAKAVSDWSAGTGSAAQPSVWALLIFIAGFLWLALMRERWRLAGLVPMLIGGGMALFPPHPGILVAPDGRQVAIRAADGRYRLLAAKPDAFITGIWLRADGDPRDAKDPTLREGTSCDPAGCVASLPDGRLVTLALARDAFADDCRQVVLIVTPLAGPACAGNVATIDRERLAEDGAIELTVRDPPVKVRAAFEPSAVAATEEGAAEIVRRGEDEDVPPGSVPPEPRAGPAPLESAFSIATAYPKVPRPWMPTYAVEEEGEAEAAAPAQ